MWTDRTGIRTADPWITGSPNEPQLPYYNFGGQRSLWPNGIPFLWTRCLRNILREFLQVGEQFYKIRQVTCHLTPSLSNTKRFELVVGSTLPLFIVHSHHRSSSRRPRNSPQLAPSISIQQPCDDSHRTIVSSRITHLTSFFPICVLGLHILACRLKPYL